MIESLPRVVPAQPDRPEMAGADHPMRKVTKQVAFEPGGWTPERAAKVGELLDALASTWHERTSRERQEPLRDALARGGCSPKTGSGLCAEIGSGTGASTPDLATHFRQVLCLDLSREMLCRAPADPGARVRADAARLPVPDNAACCVALVNALLFPNEMARVLCPGGTLIWVSSLGDRTPIYLSAEDVAAALPGTWSGVSSDAGWGCWCALRRVEAA